MSKWSDQSIKTGSNTRSKRNDIIIYKIKELIFERKLEIGHGLPSERELSAKFKVSRAVVREALKSLEQAGFVEIRIGSNGGAFVANNLHLPLYYSVHDLFKSGQLTLNHFYEVRRAIECSAVALACAKAKTKYIKRLRQINQKLFYNMYDSDKSKEGNRAFHLTIAEISGNLLCKLIVHSLLLLIDDMVPTLAKHQKFVKNMYERHEAIIDAIEARNVIACESLMAADTEFTKKLKSSK